MSTNTTKTEYNVTFTVTFTVEAADETEAIRKAENYAYCYWEPYFDNPPKVEAVG